MRIFGHVKGITSGSIFKDRRLLSKSAVHKPTQAGISGSQYEGADSIVLSGGYVDDEDFGNIIIYTGEGGNKNGKQISDQTLTGRNKALVKSKLDNLPVRVIRGYKHKSSYSPKEGYIYSGLYKVVDHWQDQTANGYIIYRYRLELFDASLKVFDEVTFNDDHKDSKTRRTQSITNRIIRDSKLAENIKRLYGFKCQICSVPLKISTGLYAEAAHIKPLGSPHNGPDKSNNLLCLCPNHHVLFDNGGFSIEDDFTLVGISETIYIHDKHIIDLKYIQYQDQLLLSKEYTGHKQLHPFQMILLLMQLCVQCYQNQ